MARQVTLQLMPRMSRTNPRASALATLIVASVAVCVTALLVVSRIDLGAFYPIKSVSAFAVAVLLALRYVEGNHPFDRFGVANQITTGRAGLVALTAGLIGEPTLPSLAIGAATVCVVAAMLDGVDGWMARRSGMSSHFGARFDLETDAALIQVLAVLVWQYGKAGPWIVAAGLLRYAFVAAGWFLPWMRGQLPSTRRARLICVGQIAALIIAMLPIVSPPVSRVIAGMGLAALTYSFAIDTLWLWRHRA